MIRTGAAPDILDTWNRYIDAYEHAVSRAPGYLPPPTDDLMRALAGALVASLTGGVADPLAGGEHVLLPDGGRARVVVTAAGTNAEHVLGMRPDGAHGSGADALAIVTFDGFRLKAVYLLASPPPDPR